MATKKKTTWWTWILAAILVLVLFSVLNREKEEPNPTISTNVTSSTEAPKAEPHSYSQPRTSNFVVLDSYWKAVPGIPTSIWVMGEVKNTGSVAAGVELEATAYDKDGRVLDSTSFWPASVRNIAAGDTCPIKFGLDANSSDVSRVQLRVVSTTVW